MLICVQGKVVENHGIRLLEAQIATGGIIDPEANHRLPIEAAFERGEKHKIIIFNISQT